MIILSEGIGSPKICVVMEPMAGGSLKDYLNANRTLHTTVVLQLARHMTSALKELSSIGVIHRNIKPDKIFMYRGPMGTFSFKLSSSYTSRIFSGIEMAAIPVSYYYSAPEVSARKYDARCDIYSVGMIMIECCIGNNPIKEAHHMIDVSPKSSSIIEQALTSVDPRLKKLISRMIALQPADRFTIIELNKVLMVQQSSITKKDDGSPWLAGFDLLDDMILAMVLSYLDQKQQVRFTRVNKKWKSFVENLTELHERLC